VLKLLGIAIMGAIGSVCRYGVNVSASAMGLDQWPWGIFAVNAVGSFAMGAIAGLGTQYFGSDLYTWLTVGLLGGFTTFSAYSLDSIQLMHAGRWMAAWSYSIGSVVVAISACGLGWWLVRR